MHNILKILVWVSIVLVLVIGLVHVIDAPDSFKDAAYKGWLFYANGAAAAIAAYGIYRKYEWAQWLGLVVAAGSFLGYVASRTVGLPFIPAEPDAWLEPLGIVALVAEGVFIVIFIVQFVTEKKNGPR